MYAAAKELDVSDVKISIDSDQCYIMTKLSMSESLIPY
jgi:hypothetical protein